MALRKEGKIYDKWHRRVEGQIRHTIGRHPEWFRFKNEDARKKCINSLAKRIVGEIVAACEVVNDSGFVMGNCELPMGKEGVAKMPSSERGNAASCSPLGKPDQPSRDTGGKS